MYRKLVYPISFILLLWLAAGNQAAETIYQDDFSGSAGTDLNGLPPDIRPGTEVWDAGAGIDADGTITYGVGGETDYGSSAYLPFTPVGGYTYELSATLVAQQATGEDPNSWLGLGFTQNKDPNDRFLEQGVYWWALTRNAECVDPSLWDQSFIGVRTDGDADANTRSADNLKIVLDTTASQWVAQWYFNGSLERTANITNPEGINYVAFTNSQNDGTVDDFLLTRELGPKAANPSPAEDVTGVLRDEDLSWTPGLYADKHDVYFGTDFDDVNNATRGSPLGVLVSEGQDANSYEPGTLAFGTKYYWRIDEVNDTDIWKGSVWSFTTLAQPGIIFYDDFDGSSEDLDGTTPDITTGGAVWDAGVWVNADGNYGGDPPGASGRSFTAALPYTPTPGAVYELTAEVDNTGNDWFAIAFLNNAPDPESRLLYNGGGSRLWELVRGQASTPSKDQYFVGPDTQGEQGNAATFSANDLKVRVEMISSTEWVVKWYFDGSKDFETTINPSTSGMNINYVAFGGNGLWSPCYGKISSFKFVEIPQALKPYPENGELILTTDVTLHWQPGKYADDHDVYVGESFTEVSNATISTPVIYKGCQDANSYPLTGLTEGTTYYWRIDEVNMAEDPNTWKGDVWSFKVQPLEAYNPSPPDGAKYMDPNVDLTWSPGAKAEFHDVYLGTDFNDVNDASRTDPCGVLVSENQGPNTYDPGTLQFDTTYYWRIDEVNTTIWKGDVWSFETKPDIPITDPNRLAWWKFDEDWGTVALDWSGYGKDGNLINGPRWEAGYIDGALEFDGLNDQVSLPIGEDINSLTSATFMTWVNFAGRGADTQRIFDFGTGTTDYMYLTPRVGQTEPMEFVINSGATLSTITAPSTLATGWHHVAVVIDGVSETMELYLDAAVVASGETELLPTDLGVTTGNWLGRSQAGDYTWFTGRLDDFRIYDYALTGTEIREIVCPPWAWMPSPADGTTVSNIPAPTLTWLPGAYAVSHDVYFGTDETKVTDANRDDPLGVLVSEDQYPCSYDPGALELGQAYYWRIDEVNDANEDSPWKGNIWSFTVANYVVVEDFDSYASSSTLRDVWKDYRVNGSRAVINLMKGTEDANLVQDGNSMWYEYLNNNAPYYAEAYADTTDLPGPIGSDWTAGGFKALVLSFYGQPDNDANELMYVALSDGSNEGVVTYGDYGEDPNDLRVEEWQEWNIDLEDFNSAGVDLTDVTRITIGLGDGAAPGGNGNVYFDDIRLYPPRCVPGRAVGDIDNDCDIDYYDLAAIRDNWLISDYNVTPQNPGTTNLVAHYEFEGDFNDSSGNGYDGDPCLATIKDSGDPCRGYVAVFDGNSYVELPIGEAIDSMTNSTFMTWADFSNDGGAWQRIFDFGNDVNEYMFLSPRIGTDGVMRFAITVTSYNDEDMVDAPDTLASGWHHVVITIDADNDIISLYLDGFLVGENTDANLTPSNLGETTNNWLGRSQYVADANYMGSLDDFRIYDRTLSQGEVAWIYGLRDEFTQPLYLLLMPANPTINSYVDGVIDLKDYAATVNWWLEEQVWP